jgi:hypothetical protein
VVRNSGAMARKRRRSRVCSQRRKRRGEEEWRREGRKSGEGARVWCQQKKEGEWLRREREVEDHGSAMCVLLTLSVEDDDKEKEKGSKRYGPRGLGRRNRWAGGKKKTGRRERGPGRRGKGFCSFIFLVYFLNIINQTQFYFELKQG